MKIKLLRKGAEMDTLIFIFIGCALIMFSAIWVYNNKESTAFHETQKKIVEQSVRLKELENLLTSNISTVSSANLRVKSLEEKIICFTQKIDSTELEVDHLQEHCAKLRESQIDIKNILSNKRPVIKVTAPIPVEVVSKPEVAGKPDPTLIKKIKKQLKEVSQ